MQIATTIIAGYFAAVFLGFTILESLYIGIAVAFSSTLIVVKLLSDKRELDTLHGRIIIGVLLVQDLVAIIALIVLSSLGNFQADQLGIALVKMLFMFGLAALSGFLFHHIFKFLAKSLELLFLAGLSWCFLFVGLAYYFNVSVAIGAFLAGLSLASLPYNIELSGRIKPVRDFFATMFFVSLGMQLAFTNIGQLIVPIIVMLLIVILIKPLATLVPLALMGHSRKTGFLTAINLAQISEFSLILIAQGYAAGHVGQQAVSLVTVLAALTILVTSYLIHYDQKLYWTLSEPLKVVERLSEVKPETIDKKKKFDALLCGHNRIGYSIIRTLVEMKKNVLIVDFNPEIVKKLKEQNLDAVYGDIGDPEILDKLHIKHVSLVVSTVPDIIDNKLLIKKVKEDNKRAVIFVTANQIEEALELYYAGADYVIMPHFLGGEHVSQLILGLQGKSHNVLRNKLEHIRELNLRRQLGHEHPSHGY